MWGANQWEVDDVLKRINELERIRRLLTADESFELSTARQKLDKLRANCSHSFKLETLFNRTKMICQFCYTEDKNYNHFRDGK